MCTLQLPEPEITVQCPSPFNLRRLPDRSLICSIVRTMLLASPCPVLEKIDYFILNDAQIMGLNRKYLGRYGPTNILSFADENGGSLYLSHITLERESSLYKQNIFDYFLLLTAHGLAHLHGLEHGPELIGLENIFLKSANRLKKEAWMAQTQTGFSSINAS